jgi:hypothetical protein
MSTSPPTALAAGVNKTWSVLAIGQSGQRLPVVVEHVTAATGTSKGRASSYVAGRSVRSCLSDIKFRRMPETCMWYSADGLSSTIQGELISIQLQNRLIDDYFLKPPDCIKVILVTGLGGL